MSSNQYNPSNVGGTSCLTALRVEPTPASTSKPSTTPHTEEQWYQSSTDKSAFAPLLWALVGKGYKAEADLIISDESVRREIVGLIRDIHPHCPSLTRVGYIDSSQTEQGLEVLVSTQPFGTNNSVPLYQRFVANFSHDENNELKVEVLPKEYLGPPDGDREEDCSATTAGQKVNALSHSIQTHIKSGLSDVKDRFGKLKERMILSDFRLHRS